MHLFCEEFSKKDAWPSQPVFPEKMHGPQINMPPQNANNQRDFIDDHIGFLYNSVVLETKHIKNRQCSSESMVIYGTTPHGA